MERPSIEVQIQLVTSVAVLIGLALVVWELQQARALTIAQLSSDALDLHNERRHAVFGDDAAVALATACEEPASLTTAQRVILDSYYSTLINAIRRREVVSSTSGVEYMEEDRWADSVAWTLAPILSSEYGRWWWSKFGPIAPERLRGIAERPTGYMGDDCGAFFADFDGWMARVEGKGRVDSPSDS